MNYYSHLDLKHTIEVYSILWEAFEIIPRQHKLTESLMHDELVALRKHYGTIKGNSIFSLDEQREKYTIKIK